jgi:hypothetical protein
MSISLLAIDLVLVRWHSLRFAESICFDSIAVGTLRERVLVDSIV